MIEIFTIMLLFTIAMSFIAVLATLFKIHDIIEQLYYAYFEQKLPKFKKDSKKSCDEYL